MLPQKGMAQHAHQVHTPMHQDSVTKQLMDELKLEALFSRSLSTVVFLPISP